MFALWGWSKEVLMMAQEIQASSELSLHVSIQIYLPTIDIMVGTNPKNNVFSCRENDGDLENTLNPLEQPKGNYHIVEDEGVYVLNRDTFAHFMMPKELVLVEFYAPW